MQFTSFLFLLFFPCVAAAFFILPRRLRPYWLLFCSLFFYLYRNLGYGVFLLVSIAITYVCARLMGPGESKNSGRRKTILVLGILANLFFLFFFKYYNFTVQNLGVLFGFAGAASPLPLLDIALPVGISFYTFQSLGYVVDVYRGQTQPEKNILTYALFVSFFPQIHSGPISRSTSLLPQLQAPAPGFDGARLRDGLVLMGWGFFKKLVVADRLELFVAGVFGNYAGQSGAVLALAVVLFAVQMYCDFSGYITIAQGAARVLGYRLDKNFDLPYFSHSIPEFWRRWHITLGSWFKDYLFYPLMRSRALTFLWKKSKKALPKHLANNLPVVLSLLVVWLCTGLWHGAAWHYVAWGLYHGLLIILGTLLAPALKKATTALRLPTNSRAFGVFQTLRTFFLVCVGYVFFRADTLADGFAYLGQMFTGFGPAAFADGTLLSFGLNLPELVAGLCFTALLWCVELAQRKHDLLAWLGRQHTALRWGVYLFGLAVILVFGMYGEGYADKPFIYFQF